MRLPAPRILGPIVLIALASALPVAISTTWGWLAAGLVALAGGALVAAGVTKRHVAPMEELAASVRPYVTVPHATAEDLARLVAYEYRDALSRLKEGLSDARLREAALEHATDGVLLVGESGLVEYANPAAKALHRGRVMEISHRIADPRIERLVQQAAEAGAPLREELTLRLPAARHVLAEAVPLVQGGTVVLLQDLSESYRLDRVRRDFVANVSHDLKTPVAGMRALADVAASALADGDSDTAHRFVRRLGDEAERLSELVSDLLDLSRVESGQDMHLERVEVRGLLDNVAGRVRAAAEARGLSLSVSGPAVEMEADASQLGMALQNLVDNAIRYSESGAIRAHVDRSDGWAAITVSDEGIGIPGDELPRIFERFYRVDRARARATGGTGLGLSIVRHVAENHGGRVDVTSELGAGSKFSLLIPLPGAEGRGTST